MTTATKAMFIAVEKDHATAHDEELTKKLVEVCPVNVFATGSNRPATLSSRHATCREGRSPTGGAGVSPAFPNSRAGEWAAQRHAKQQRGAPHER